MRTTWIRATVLAALLVAMLCACRWDAKSADPPRPDSVPESALWIGGPDGGAFVEVKAPQDNVYAVAVFDESGDLWFRGPMILDREPEKSFAVGDRSAYSAWDGKRVLLADGRSLVSR